ncbi:stage II sporulation protein M [candidate division KSB1 bacterium]|nr:stage II sporulation protein M [candidate division KSB1 bacterium]
MIQLKWLLCAALFYAGGMLSGWILNDVIAQNPPLLSPAETKSFDSLHLKHFEGQSFVRDFTHIAGVNLMVVSLIALGGRFTAGILSALLLIWNGFLLACTLHGAFCLKLPLSLVLCLYALHGPLEITAFLLAGAIGLEAFSTFTRSHTHKTPSTARQFVAAIGPTYALTLIAASIESGVINLVAIT